MKKRLGILILSLGLTAGTIATPLIVEAAKCTDDNGTVTGDVCGLIEGECVCYDRPKA